MPETADSATPDSLWASVLDELEARTQATGPTGLEPWRQGASLPALPAALAARAREVQAAQQHAIDGLREEQRRIRAELESLGSVQTPRADAEPPVYLDLIG